MIGALLSSHGAGKMRGVKRLGMLRASFKPLLSVRMAAASQRQWPPVGVRLYVCRVCWASFTACNHRGVVWCGVAKASLGNFGRNARKKAATDTCVGGFTGRCPLWPLRAIVPSQGWRVLVVAMLLGQLVPASDGGHKDARMSCVQRPIHWMLRWRRGEARPPTSARGRPSVRSPQKQSLACTVWVDWRVVAPTALCANQHACRVCCVPSQMHARTLCVARTSLFLA